MRYQEIYDCKDCFDSETIKKKTGCLPCICKNCSLNCHKGHNVVKVLNEAAFCDCGGEFCKQKCKSIPEEDKNKAKKWD